MINWKEATTHDDFEQWDVIDSYEGVTLAEVGVGVYCVESWGCQQIFEDWTAAQASYLNKVEEAETC